MIGFSVDFVRADTFNFCKPERRKKTVANGFYGRLIIALYRTIDIDVKQFQLNRNIRYLWAESADRNAPIHVNRSKDVLVFVGAKSLREA